MSDSVSQNFSPELLEFVDELGDVEILSTTAMSLLRELTAGNLSSKQLSQKISEDPTLSASLLKLANSAYYGIPNRVSTVSHAVSLLGFTAVRNLVQGLCLSNFSHPEIGLNKKSSGREFGAHSMAVSKMAGVLTKKFGFPTVGQGEAETAGLLHDIGFLLIAATKTDAFAEWVKTCREQTETAGKGNPRVDEILRSEEKVFGFTHPELGAWLAQKWNLPLMIREALMFHHGDISECVNRECAAIIQLANLLCNENEMGYIPEGYWGDADPGLLRFLDSQRKLEIYESFPHSIQNEIEEIKQLYDFVSAGMKRSADKESSPTKQSRIPDSPSTVESRKIPSWSLLVPGLPHFYKGRNPLGGTLLVVFLGAIGTCGLGLSAGNVVLGFGALAVAGLVWVGSILSS